MQRFNGSSAMGRTGSILSELSFEKDPRNSEEMTSTLLESQETKSKSTQWTDEKHSLYLKSMETSFVNQLYDSLDPHGGSSRQEYSSELQNSRQMNNGVPTPSGQFKVFKDGSWARVSFSNFRREMSQPKKAEKSDPIMANPWIQHYRSSVRHQTRISPTLQERASVSTMDPSAFQFNCKDSKGSNAEVTDQNFVDEVSEDEKASRKRGKKCRKISAASTSSNDGVVPSATLSLLGDMVEVHGSQKEQEHGIEQAISN